jgi:S-adenosylmethionine uptake transporter
MLFASFAFSAMGAAVKLASAYYSTSELVMYRGLIGTLVLLAMVRQQSLSLKTAFAREHFWRSVVGVTSLWMWFYAIGKLPLATAITLNYMAPIWIATWMFFIGWWRSRGRPEWPLVLAISMSFVGVILVLRPAVETQQWMGALAGVMSSVISAAAYLQVRNLGKMGEPEYRVVFYFMLTTTLAGILGAFLEGHGHVAFHTHTWQSGALILGIGVMGLMAQMAMTRAYRTGAVLVVANLQYTGIIFSSLWGMALWGDVFDWHVWLGMAVILASGVAATFYNTKATARGAVVEKTDPIASEL